MIKRPFRGYIEGYFNGLGCGGCWSYTWASKRFQRAFDEGTKDGKIDREHIEAGRYFLPGQGEKK